MDTTTKTRPVTILCATESHDSCLSAINPQCECSCHFTQTVSSNAQNLAALGVQLWRLTNYLEILTAEERKERVLSIVRNAEGFIDFKGFTAEEVAERFEPTMTRGYWSLRETNEDFGLDSYTGERLES